MRKKMSCDCFYCNLWIAKEDWEGFMDGLKKTDRDESPFCPIEDEETDEGERSHRLSGHNRALS